MVLNVVANSLDAQVSCVELPAGYKTEVQQPWRTTLTACCPHDSPGCANDQQCPGCHSFASRLAVQLKRFHTRASPPCTVQRRAASPGGEASGIAMAERTGGDRGSTGPQANSPSRSVPSLFRQSQEGARRQSSLTIGQLPSRGHDLERRY